MKTKVCFIFIFSFATLTAQWHLQNPTPITGITKVTTFGTSTVAVLDAYNEYASVTTDKGVTWKTFNFKPSDIVDIALLSETNWVVNCWTKLMTTYDAGITWTTSAPSESKLLKMSFCDGKNGVILTGNSSLLITTDGGDQWSQVALSDSIIDILLVSPTELYLHKCVKSGLLPGSALLYSYDFGKSVSQIFLDSTKQIFAFSFMKGGRGLLAARKINRPIVLMHTNGNDFQWDTVSTGSTDSYSIVADEFDSSFLFKKTNAIVKTKNPFTQWDTLTVLEGANMYFSTISFSKDGVGCVAGSRTTRFTSDNGNTWSEISQAYGKEDLFSVKFLDAVHGVATGEFGSILYTSNGGTTWLQSYSPSTDSILHLANIGNILWACGSNGCILKSSNKGAVWEKSNSNVHTVLYSIAFADSLTGVAVGEDGICIRTSDGGGSWQKITIGSAKYLFGISFLNSTEALIVGDGGLCLKTTDAGLTWKTIFNYNSLDMWLADVTTIQGTNIAFAVGATGVMGEKLNILKTTDAGETWVQSNVNASPAARTVAFSDSLHGYVVLDWHAGLYVTNDGGLTWTLGDMSGNAVATVGPDVWIVGDGGYIHYTNGNITNVENSLPLPQPSQFELLQNYPNPFNPTTTISYNLPQSGLVNIVIYDVLGKEIKRLVSEYKQAGSYRVNFDASALASGVYFYSLRANDFVSTKKMLLLK